MFTQRTPKVIGIIGRAGHFGKWLERFFRSNYPGCTIIGSDPKLRRALSNEQVVQKADVVIFAVSLPHIVSAIEELVEYSREDQLWMDIASVKVDPVRSMLKSKAEVVGLHPLCAPTAEVLSGETLVYCPVRLKRFTTWVHRFLAKTRMNRVQKSPEEHDRYMAVVQALPQAVLLIMGAVIRARRIDMAVSCELATPQFRAAWATLARILHSGPELAAGIQLCNGENPLPIVTEIAAQGQKLLNILREQDQASLIEWFDLTQSHFTKSSIEAADKQFEEIKRRLAPPKRKDPRRQNARGPR